MLILLIDCCAYLWPATMVNKSTVRLSLAPIRQSIATVSHSLVVGSQSLDAVRGKSIALNFEATWYC
jgi:hypothetical protein